MTPEKVIQLQTIVKAIILIPAEAKKVGKHDVYKNIQKNHSLGAILTAINSICTGQSPESSISISLDNIQNFINDIHKLIPELNLNSFPIPLEDILKELRMA
jgi:hypothetical protein